MSEKLAAVSVGGGGGGRFKNLLGNITSLEITTCLTFSGLRNPLIVKYSEFAYPLVGNTNHTRVFWLIFLRSYKSSVRKGGRIRKSPGRKTNIQKSQSLVRRHFRDFIYKGSTLELDDGLLLIETE